MVTKDLLLLFLFVDSSEKLFVQVLASHLSFLLHSPETGVLALEKQYVLSRGRLGFEILLDAEKDEAILYFKKCVVV